MFKKHKKQKIERFSDVERLIERIDEESPASGDYLYDYKLEQAKQQANSIDQPEFHRKYKINFADLPISSSTINGLSQRNFTKMTQIQRCVIPHALCGRDILAASRTGSGKTLAYLVPLVQKLYRNKFIPIDGLGAIILVPVRQLAMQVFQVLNSFTKNSQLSVGLIIGGKDQQLQKQKIQSMNILICTPGRLLQHLEETYGFETNNLQMLVIDQADQMLQIGFRQALMAILKSIPARQTMLFSATLTKNIHNLAGLSLNNPERIFLHTTNPQEQTLGQIYETPLKLAQYYMLVDVDNKLNTLYSFIKEHPKKKILIFLSTCKQVRFYYETFKTFRFGCPIYQLQGKQKQNKRMAIFYTFCQKKYGILFCTNIASRGLDFPQIDWVIQVDVPEDVETYVHRVGRTARFRSEGRGLMFVMPSEEGFVEQLKQSKIAINRISQNPQKLYSITNSVEARCTENQQLKYLAQRALISYLRFVFKAANKKVFDVHKVDASALALSFGLTNPPIINFKKKEEDEEEQGPKMTKIEKIRMKSKMKKEEKNKQLEEQHDDILKYKGKFESKDIKTIPSLSNRQLKKIKLDGHFEGKNKIFFDEDGKPMTDAEMTRKRYQPTEQHDQDLSDKFRQRIQINREVDLQTEKQRRKEKRQKRKLREQQQREGVAQVELASSDPQ